jgi:hypothetical protein
LTYLARQKCYGPDKKILLKKLIIWPWGQRSRSHEGHYGMRHTTLWSCTHIPNKYYLKKQLFDLEVKGQGSTKVIMVHDTPPYGHAPTYQISLTYLERQKCYGPDKKILFKKTIIWPWGQRSRSHEGHYGMWHTALWSCTHIPNIIDLSGKNKKLWSGQASLRSRRKNQIKTICLPSFEGET